MRSRMGRLLLLPVVVVSLVALARAGAAGAQTAAAAASKKVFVLGLDGLDPLILERLMQAGELPNFKRLIAQGDMRPLQTSMPPLSPVAWSNFITGMNPGGHGIFDFIHRDPDTMLPYLSTSRTEAPKRTIRIGKWVIPLSAGKVRLLRRGKAFWDILAEHGIPVTVVRAPANFPPAKGAGRQLSGMGTPDIHGTYGLFSYYTDAPPERKDVDGGDVFPVRVVHNRVQASLVGPRNMLRVDEPPSTVDFTVFVDEQYPVAKIVVQKHEFLLQAGEWSPWVHVQFPMIPLLKQVHGMVRFYLKEAHPHFKLYVTPINIDPTDPALPITTPAGFASELARAIGPFYTQGMPYDTKALSNGILDDGDFLQQAHLVFAEQLKMLEYTLKRFKAGLLFFYFGRVDQLAHMYWRTMDSKSPGYDPDSRYTQVIEQTYRDMDAVLAKVRQHLDPDTTLLVMSDHGFAPFYRSFNLNSWLQREGYIVLKDEDKLEESPFFEKVRWSRTRAYAVGFNGLYINLQGRERFGIVRPGAQRQAVMQEIAAKLLALRDPETGQRAIYKVYRAEDIYSGAALGQAPDLLIGYNRGYRVSWESALGQFSHRLFKDNTEKWSGDHAMAFELVPGVLIANRPIRATAPALYDLAPTILREFGLPKQANMVGSNLF